MDKGLLKYYTFGVMFRPPPLLISSILLYYSKLIEHLVNQSIHFDSSISKSCCPEQGDGLL